MIRFFLFLLIGVVLTACLPVEISPTPIPAPTETVTVTPPPSATIVWFPATPTFTPAPTQEITPTQEVRPEIGALILDDRFNDPQSWMTSRTAVGSIAFGENELTLAVAAPKGSLLSLRATPQLDNFYLEIEALPSLCRADDQYGLLLRASSLFDYYRLLISCNGQLRMERLNNGKYTVLQDWVTSGQIFPGGMIPVRLGVWAQKDELRIFANDTFQFTVRDPVWVTGQVGVFARSEGETPLTVNFSKLRVYHLEAALTSGQRTSTAAPTLNRSKTPVDKTPTPMP